MFVFWLLMLNKWLVYTQMHWSLKCLFKRILISSSCLSLKKTIIHLTIFVLYMVSFVIPFHECVNSRIKNCKPLVFKPMKCPIRRAQVSDTRRCRTLTRNRQLSLHWIVSFSQIIIYVNVSVFVSCPVCVSVSVLHRFKQMADLVCLFRGIMHKYFY
jgi:hypothetical protein